MKRIEIRFTPLPRLIIHQDLPEKAVIKKIAHALTILTAAWIGVSVFALVAYRVGKEEGYVSWISAANWAWCIHGIFAILSLICWLVEKPSEVHYLKEYSGTKKPNQAPEPTTTAGMPAAGQQSRQP